MEKKAIPKGEIIPKQTFPILDLEAAKKRFQPYIEKIDGILKEAQDLKVETDEANQKAVEIGTSAVALAKQISAVRIQAINEPWNFVKGVNSFSSIFLDKLILNDKKTNANNCIEGLMKEKISTYRAFQEQRRREAELAAKKATEDLQKKLNEDAKKAGTVPVQVEMPIVPKQETITRTETGVAYGTKRWTFKVTEPHLVRKLIESLNYQDGLTHQEKTIIKLKALVPYLCLSKAEIMNAIKAGIREIPGIKIFEEDQTSFRT